MSCTITDGDLRVDWLERSQAHLDGPGEIAAKRAGRFNPVLGFLVVSTPGKVLQSLTGSSGAADIRAVEKV